MKSFIISTAWSWWKWHMVPVWIALKPAVRLWVAFSASFFFFCQLQQEIAVTVQWIVATFFLLFRFFITSMGLVYCSWDPQISLFNNFFIKNRSYDTIYTFKNYFATVFSVSVFSFNNNKFNPNGPSVFVCQKLFLLTYFTIQLIFVNISGFHNTFWYYSWVSLYYFS